MSYGESSYIIWGGSSCVTYEKSSYIIDVLVFSVSPLTAMSIKQLPLCATCQCHPPIYVGVLCVTPVMSIKQLPLCATCQCHPPIYVGILCVTPVMSIKQLPLCATYQCHHQICVGVLCVTTRSVLVFCVTPDCHVHKTTATMCHMPPPDLCWCSLCCL